MSKGTGTWHKRGKDAYTLEVSMGTDYAGKRIRFTKTVHCKSDKMADKELAIFYADCVSGNVKRTSSLTVNGLCEQYMALSVNLTAKRNTIRGYQTIINSRISRIKNVKADKLTRLKVQEWVNDLSETLSPKTVKNSLSFLHSAYDWGIKKDILTQNPCDYIDLPRQERKEAKSYTEDEVRVFLDGLNDLPENQQDYKVAVLLALFCGLRRGEICGLDWNHITGNLINVVQTRNLAIGEGIFIDTPKTNSSVRTVAAPEEVMIEIEKLKEYQKKMSQFWEIKSPAVIKGPFGSPLWPNILSEWTTKYEEKIGLPKIGLHGLRHTHASMLANITHDVVKTSKRLGHSQISTTMNIYTHLFENGDNEIANEISAVFLQNK